MKLPCELVVYELLPVARRELAYSLVTNYDYSQNKVAEIFGVTAAAISQYLRGIRGTNELIDSSKYKDDFYKMIDDSAGKIHAGEDITEVLCEICTDVKRIGMLAEIYKNMGEETILSDCFDCPRDNIISYAEMR